MIQAPVHTSVLSVKNLKTCFFSRDGVATPVDDVSFELPHGETLAIVGESGSGKSVTSLSIMGLLPRPAGRIVSGRIDFTDSQGKRHDLAQASPDQLRRIRGGEISMIFQEPMTSLNPLFTVGDQIAEAVMLHEKVSRRDAFAAARRMLDLVEIPAADRRVHDYPHQMSGGMRQRVMIALALSCNPSLLIADEPTTALDVTIQAQILDLLRRLQAERRMSILFITHNMGVVAEMAHHVAVMYAGRIVETAPVAKLFARPSHPYTRGLLACIPTRSMAGMELVPIPGSVPNLMALPKGCAFASRCAYADDGCRAELPDMAVVDDAHYARCRRLEVVQ